MYVAPKKKTATKKETAIKKKAAAKKKTATRKKSGKAKAAPWPSSSPSSSSSSSSAAQPQAAAGVIVATSGLQNKGHILSAGGETYDAELEFQEGKSDKFYKMQIIEKNAGGFAFVQHWGRVGAKGQCKVDNFSDAAGAVGALEKKFKAKSGIKFSERNSAAAKGGKYVSKVLQKGESYEAADLGDIRLEERWSWTPSGGRKYLDASCLLYDNGGKHIATLDYAHKASPLAPGVIHSGDKLDHKSGTHIINIDLNKLPKKATSLYFTVSAYSAARLCDIVQPSFHLLDATAGHGKSELCSYELEDLSAKDLKKKAVVMCVMRRVPGGDTWSTLAIGQPCEGSVQDYNPIMQAIAEIIRGGLPDISSADRVAGGKGGGKGGGKKGKGKAKGGGAAPTAMDVEGKE